MPFFQNPFPASFSGNWVLSDRQYNQTLAVRGNSGRGDESVISWGTAPFDLSGNDADGNSKAVLTLSFALNDFKAWSDLAVTISGATQSAVTAFEVVDDLNSNARFADYFIASVQDGRVLIRQLAKFHITRLHFYVKNGRAETALLFNARAGVDELPVKLARHTIENRFTFSDSQNMLIQLDPDNSDVDAAVITAATDAHGNPLNYDPDAPKEEWELLAGKVGLFKFKKQTVDDSDRVTEIIEYHAGSIVGDLARKTIYTYTDDNQSPDTICEIPYTLESGDLITP